MKGRAVHLGRLGVGFTVLLFAAVAGWAALAQTAGAEPEGPGGRAAAPGILNGTGGTFAPAWREGGEDGAGSWAENGTGTFATLPAPAQLTADGQSCGAFILASEDTPILAWGDLAGESGYDWQVWTGVLCTGSLAAGGSTGKDVTFAEVLPALAEGTYHWRVRGVGDGGGTATGPWACGCPFTVGMPPCTTTELVNPEISVNTTWDTGGSPYIVHGTLTVDSGVTLAIAAGVLVKFDMGASATVYGTLDVDGTSSNLVAFGSLNDHSLCGPSIGGSGMPNAGDWNGISFPAGSSATLDYALVRHAGVGLAIDTEKAFTGNNLTVERCTIGVGTGAASAPVFTTLNLNAAPVGITASSHPTVTGGVWDGGGVLMEAGVVEYGWLSPGATPDPIFSGVTLQNMAPGGLPALRISAGSPVSGSTHWVGVPFLLSGTVAVASTGRLDAYDTTVYGVAGTSARLDVSGTLNLGSAGTSTHFRSSSSTPAPGDWVGIHYLAGSQGTVRDTAIRHASWGLQIETAGVTSVSGLTLELCDTGMTISGDSMSPAVSNLTTTLCTLGLGISGTATTAPTFTNYHSLQAPLGITRDSRPTFTGGVWDGGGVLMEAGVVEYGWLSPGATPDPMFSGVTLQNMAPGGVPALRISAGSPIAGSTHWVGVPFLLSGTVAVASTGRLDAYDTTVYGVAGTSARLEVSGTLNLGSAGTSTHFRSSSSTPAPGDWVGIHYLAGSQGTVRDTAIRHASWGLQIETAGVTSVSGLTLELCDTGMTISGDSMSPAVSNLTTTLCTLGLGISGTATTAPTFTNYHSLQAPLGITRDSRPTFTGGVWDGGGVLTEAGVVEYGWPGPGETPDPTFSGVTIQNMASAGLPALRISAMNPIARTTHWAGVPFIVSGTVEVSSTGRLDAYDTTVYGEAGTSARLDVSGTLNLGRAGTSTLFRCSGAAPVAGDWLGVRYLPGSSGSVTDTTIRHAAIGIGVETGNPLAVVGLTAEQCQLGAWTAGFSSPAFTNLHLDGSQMGITGNSHPTFTGGVWDGGGVLSDMGYVEYNEPNPGNTPDPVFSGVTIQNMAPGGLGALWLWAISPISGSTHWAGVPFVFSGTVAVAATGRVDAYRTTVCGQAGGSYSTLEVSGTLNLGRAGTSTLFRSASATPSSGDWVGIRYLPGSSGSVTDTTIRHAGIGLSVETGSPFVVSALTVEQCYVGLQAGGDSSPRIERSRFADDSTAVGVTGAAMPDLGYGAQSSAGYNTIIGATMSLENGTANPISAQYNWWGCPTTAEMDAGIPDITLIYDHADDPGRGAVDYAHWLGTRNRSIRAAKDTSGGARDVLLTWPQEPTGTLTIMRGTDPQSLSPVGTTGGASWRDVGALDAPGIYYYEVVGPCP